MKKQWKPLLLILLLIALVGTLSVFAFASTGDTVEQGIKIEEFSLSLENAVYMNFKVSSDNISDTEDIELLVWDDAPTAYERASAQYILTSNGAEDETGYECYQYTNLAAKDMTKTVYACAYYYNGTDEIYSNPVKFSVAMYADMQKSVAVVDEGLVKLLDKMLAYGAEAQTYFNHNTDFLATDEVHMLRVVGGTLSDGFNLGWYKEGSQITMTANTPDEGYVFSHWENSAGENVGEEEALTVSVSQVETYTAVYEEEIDYFIYTKLTDGTNTYRVKANPDVTLPADLVIPSNYNGAAVTEIEAWGFKNQASIVSVSIPSSITNIGSYAFFGCTKLANIDIQHGLKSIDDCAFNNCTSLSSIELPDSVTSIGTGAFSSCTQLTSIMLSRNLLSMGSSAFNGCSSLIDITIPDGVTNIPYGTFYNCKNLTSITLSNNLISIDSYAFYSCTNLTNIELPNSITSIGNNAFQQCFSIKRIAIPIGVTSIKDSTFMNCIGLTKVVLPDGITSIERSAFDSCSSLTEINIPNNVTEMGVYAFCGCSFTNIVIPDSITTIGFGAFQSCRNLTNIVLPNGITSINKLTFSGCSSLTSIVIPNSVTSIDDSALRQCPNLTDIYFTGTEDEWVAISKENANIPASATIHYNYVPEA